MNKKIEVKSQNYIITHLQDDLTLFTQELNDELAFSAFSPQLKKIGLARNLDANQFVQFFAEINPENIKDVGLITVRIAGGTKSENSLSSLNQLLLQLQNIDNNLAIINIASCDSCDKIHPNSFEIDCYHGGIRGVN